MRTLRTKLVTAAVLAVLLLLPTGMGAATGTLFPMPRIGVTVPALAKLNIYTAGTTTRATTYSDVSLTTPNTNPLVADANGLFGPVYVAAASYKVILTTSADVTIFSQDNIAAFGLTATASNINDICDGRLTLSSGNPVPGDVSAAATIYWTPYKGNRVTLYDGSTWNIYTFAEISRSVAADTADKNYDLYAYVSSGSVALEAVVWTSATVRATALTTQDGVYVKSGDATRRYLGTYRTTSVAGQTEDSGSKRFVWNYYNRVARFMRVRDTTDSWTYTTATLRQANNSVSNQLAVVIGVAESAVRVQTWAYAANTAANVLVSTSIGEDSTAAVASGVVGMAALTQVANQAVSATSSLDKITDAGYHFYAWLEFSAATGTTTWYGDNGNGVTQAGIFGTVWS